ncbi:prion-inhibition and propagation-domain-containing protein, partial [Fusarium tricinctum]
MEVAGLSIGAVALIGTFKDCIDLFSMITAARSLGRDAEILDTKLDVEKMLFLQWADRVGLVKPDGYDTRLDDPVTHQTVARVLSSVRTLLSEGKALQERYGLRPFEKYRDLAQITNGGDEASRSRMIRFLRDVEQIGTGRIISVSKNNTLVPDKTENNTKTKAYSTTDRFRWVVSDKDKFIGLVGELSYFNSRLNALVPGNVSSIMSMTEEDLSNLRNTTKLNLIVEVAVGHQPPVVEAARRVINQNRILQRLWFRWIDDRRKSVMDAHFKTLRWALNPPEGAMKWDDLCVWLQQGSGIFWLAGKPGSGKSTLMKYLYTHPRTKQLLGTWAKDFELIFADFFFYHLGMEEQKSQEGLLRGILFQVLDTDPLLIETVLPNMWREAIKTENEADHSLAMPSIVEMRTSILALCRDQCVKRKLFLMIDGLDEYNGRHMEAASFFQELGRSANVKILIASRPEPAFVAAFARSPKMNLQDLTREDVAEYINDTVTSHPYMAILSAMSPKGPKEIVNELITKASGVFLWVVLACRSILDGFADFDTISDLKARVDELPPELEDLFRHMLSKILGRYREQGVKILRLIFDNQSKKEVDPVPTLGLALIDEYGLRTDFRGPSLSYLPQDQQYLKCMMMEGRLRSRCCGLLEIQNTS